ncbi:transcription antitermination factor NusB [Candidatus Daviesbacteria bacterium]|nr:transcription antitermination factor NusB [Candidatus Daviesbacteria bacterium]
MKTAQDPRHKRRVKIIRELFSWEFNKKGKLSEDSQTIVSHLTQIDKLIGKSAPDRPVSQINRIDLAILRLAVFELIIKKGTPLKVVIDEAVELAKKYGSDSSSKLVNGALGKLVTYAKLN